MLSRTAMWGVFLAVSLAPGLSTSAEARNVNDWGEVMSIEPGTTVWIRTRDSELTEVAVARVSEKSVSVGVVSAMESSKASREQILSRCADPSGSRLMVRGELVDFAGLCRTWGRDEVLEVHARKKKSPLRPILIGSIATAALMFYPCGLAPQADGSASGCRVTSAGVGALIGLAVHGARRGDRVLIYENKETPSPESIDRFTPHLRSSTVTRSLSFVPPWPVRGAPAGPCRDRQPR